MARPRPRPLTLALPPHPRPTSGGPDLRLVAPLRPYADVFSSQLAYMDALPPDVRSGLTTYTRKGMYYEFNKLLASGGSLVLYETVYDALGTALSDVPALDTPVLLYRGLTAGAEGLDLTRMSKQLNSTSYLPSVADSTFIQYNFQGQKCCLLKITVPAGARVLPLGRLSRDPEEEEVLLPPGGTWHLVNMDVPIVPGHATIYNLVYVP